MLSQTRTETRLCSLERCYYQPESGLAKVFSAILKETNKWKKELTMKRFIFTTLTVCLFAAVALAQSQTGNLVGTVSDASGLVQGATIVVKDNQTGTEKTVVTGDNGGFTLSQL